MTVPVRCMGGPCDGQEVEIEEGTSQFVCPRLEPAIEPLSASTGPIPKVLHLYYVSGPGRADYLGRA